MQHSPESRTQVNESPHPTAAQSLSESAIRRQLRSDAVQYPATVLPLGVCGMSGIYLLILLPVFGGGIWAGVVLVLSGVAAFTSFTWRYIFRYSEDYAERVREAKALQERTLELAERSRAAERLQELQAGFSSVGSVKGLEVFFRLVGEYDRLEPTLIRQTDSDLVSISRVPALAEETYRRGLSVLSDALELMQVVDASAVDDQERDVAELEKEVEESSACEAQGERLQIKGKVLDSQRKRLEMLDQVRAYADQLLFQAQRCEDSLHRTRIELVVIKTGSAEASVDSVIEALQRTITQAKVVQQELKRLGY